jgi:hypothetical protein
MAEDSKTPLLDQLEEGPWPSFVTEMKRAAEKKDSAKDLLLQLERSYNDRIGHWKHGGIVGVRGYGGGVIGVTPTCPKNSRLWLNSIPYGSICRLVGFIQPINCASYAMYGTNTAAA